MFVENFFWIPEVVNSTKFAKVLEKNSPNPRYHKFFYYYTPLCTHPPSHPKNLPTLNFKTWLNPHPQSQTHTQTLSPKLLPRSHVPGIVARVVGDRTVNKLVPEHWRVARVSRAHGPARDHSPLLFVSFAPSLSRARALSLPRSRCLARLLARSIDRLSLSLSLAPAQPALCVYLYVYMCGV